MIWGRFYHVGTWFISHEWLNFVFMRFDQPILSIVHGHYVIPYCPYRMGHTLRSETNYYVEPSLENSTFMIKFLTLFCTFSDIVSLYSIRLHCRWWIHPVRLLHPNSNWNIYESSISIIYSKNIWHSLHLTFHLVVPSWILIALIGLAPLEENMNPLFFWYQLFLALALIKNFKSKKQRYILESKIFWVSNSPCKLAVRNAEREGMIRLQNFRLVFSTNFDIFTFKGFDL